MIKIFRVCVVVQNFEPDSFLGQVVVKGQLDDIDTTLVTRPPQATLFSQLPGNDPSRPLERKPLKRHLADLIEKPPEKGPFTCRICFAIFSGWTGLVNKQLISV